VASQALRIEGTVINALKGFAAGFLATLLFHQPVLWLLNATGFIDRAPYSMVATKPFGVPSVISLAFWGGVWGIILLMVLRNHRGARYWIIATLVGAIAPTLVAAFVIAPLRGQPLVGNRVKLLIMGLLVNAAWGIGTALFLELFRARSSRIIPT
jgi:predicted outer membrane lipoprotein